MATKDWYTTITNYTGADKSRSVNVEGLSDETISSTSSQTSSMHASTTDNNETLRENLRQKAVKKKPPG